MNMFYLKLLCVVLWVAVGAALKGMKVRLGGLSPLFSDPQVVLKSRLRDHFVYLQAHATKVGAEDERILSPGRLSVSKFLNLSTETRETIPYTLTSTTDVFCNREINMRNIDAIGFDMDFTLAQYKKEFNQLSYDCARDKLINWLNYPSSDIATLQYDGDICRRGCLIDKRRGNILKLDKHKYVRHCEHGLSPLSDDQRKSIYRASYQESESFQGPDFVNVDTPFSLVDACLFAQLVDLKDRVLSSSSSSSSSEQTNTAEASSRVFWSSKTYAQLWTDLRRCVDRCHKDGSIKDRVTADPAHYLQYDPKLFKLLASLRRANKKLFLLTNSLWEYTDCVMNYLQGRKTLRQKNRDLKWTEYFDVIIVGGNKPAFLLDDRLSLFRVNTSDGSLSPVDHVPYHPVSLSSFLSQGKVFQGGHFQLLHRLLGLHYGGADHLLDGDKTLQQSVDREDTAVVSPVSLSLSPSLSSTISSSPSSPPSTPPPPPTPEPHHLIYQSDRLLYVGDHIYADVLRSKRSLGWRTVWIVPELPAEMLSHRRVRKERQQITQMRRVQLLLEAKLDGLRLQKLHLSDRDSSAQDDVQSLCDQITQLEQEIASLSASLKERQREVDRAFHLRWGPLFRAGFQESRLAGQIRDIACLYTSKVSNLLQISPYRVLRPPRDRSPHELWQEETL